ncbi:MAG: helix-turn-helix transcriptional regulator [Selenomonadaceae bacterium]|nr:helix-turn-helix transcriptional regulator [Selenomonadaceae bacterium]
MKHANHLQAARELSGKTQAQVAADLNMSFRSYQNYEYGMGAQTIKTAIRIAKNFNTTVENLWGDKAPQAL